MILIFMVEGAKAVISFCILSRSSLLPRGNTPSGSVAPSWPPSPRSNRCGSPSKSTMNLVPRSSTGNASRLASFWLFCCLEDVRLFRNPLFFLFAFSRFLIFITSLVLYSQNLIRDCCYPKKKKPKRNAFIDWMLILFALPKIVSCPRYFVTFPLSFFESDFIICCSLSRLLVLPHFFESDLKLAWSIQ